MFESFFEVYPEIETFGLSDFVIPYSDEQNDRIFLGRLLENGQNTNIWLNLNREQVICIVGKRGSGKSYTAGTLFEAFGLPNSKISKNEEPRCAIMFDLLDIYWSTAFKPSTKHKSLRNQLELLESWDLDPQIPNIQILIPHGYKSKATLEEANEIQISTKDIDVADWASLLRIDLIREPMGYLFLMAFTKVTSEGWNRNGNLVAPNSEYEIQDLIDCINFDNELISPDTGFDIRTRRAVVSKLASMRTLGLIVKNGTRISEILRPEHITVIMLGNLPEDIRDVVCNIFFRKIVDTRYEVSQATKQLLIKTEIDQDEKEKLEGIISEGVPRIWILIDEIHNLAPSNRKTAASDILVKMVKQGRNYGIGLIMTSQQPQAIDAQIMSQVDMIISHQLTVSKDIDTVRNNLKSSEPQRIVKNGQQLDLSEVLRRISTKGTAMVSCTDIERYFIMKIRPRVSAHGGFEA